MRRRFRAAVDAFASDFVIVTDSWNFKPLLAEAVRDYRYLLRLAALECLCPLNNIRLLFEEGKFKQCPQHQLATADVCRRCVETNGGHSGSLHQVERASFIILEMSSKYKQSAFSAPAGKGRDSSKVRPISDVQPFL